MASVQGDSAETAADPAALPASPGSRRRSFAPESAAGADAHETAYDSTYHRKYAARSRQAAARALPIVFEIVDVSSVVDVGCGYGTWLSTARDLGVTVLEGVEGPWAASWRDAFDSGVRMTLHDLEQPIALDRRFDLAICLEVAEHLSPARGPGLIADLCRLGRCVLFSAAVPGQGGAEHVNERPLSAWVAEFAVNDYRLLDVLRRRLWDDETVPYYYRQNLTLFVPVSEWAAAAAQAASLPSPPETAGIDIVHPGLVQERVREIEGVLSIPSLRDPRQIGVRDRLRLALGLPGALMRSVRRRGAARRFG